MLRIFSGDEEGGLFVEGNEKKSQFHNARNLTRHAVLLKTIQKANQLNINSSTLVHLNNKTIKKSAQNLIQKMTSLIVMAHFSSFKNEIPVFSCAAMVNVWYVG